MCWPYDPAVKITYHRDVTGAHSDISVATVTYPSFVITAHIEISVAKVTHPRDVIGAHSDLSNLSNIYVTVSTCHCILKKNETFKYFV